MLERIKKQLLALEQIVIGELMALTLPATDERRH